MNYVRAPCAARRAIGLDKLVTLRRPTEMASSQPRPKTTGEDEEITVPSVKIEEWPTECWPRTFNACRAAKSKMRRDGGRVRGGSRSARRGSDKWKPLSHKTEEGPGNPNAIRRVPSSTASAHGDELCYTMTGHARARKRSATPLSKSCKTGELLHRGVWPSPTANACIHTPTEGGTHNVNIRTAKTGGKHPANGKHDGRRGV